MGRNSLISVLLLACVRPLLCRRAIDIEAMEISVLKVPEGCTDVSKAKLGEFVSVHYTGSVGKDGKGKVFDSTRNAGRGPFVLELGSKRHPLMDAAIAGMCVGEKREFLSPPDDPSGKWLHFNIELMYRGSTKPTPEQQDPMLIFRIMDRDHDSKVDLDEARLFGKQRRYQKGFMEDFIKSADLNADDILDSEEFEATIARVEGHVANGMGKEHQEL